MAENKVSCVSPAGGPVVDHLQISAYSQSEKKEAMKMSVQVGKPAPDFEAKAFKDGDFKKVKLSDYKGQWVVLCFYPGDFTFV